MDYLIILYYIQGLIKREVKVFMFSLDKPVDHPVDDRVR